MLTEFWKSHTWTASKKIRRHIRRDLNRLIVETKVGWNWFVIIPLPVLALDEILGFQQQTVGSYRILTAFNFIRF